MFALTQEDLKAFGTAFSWLPRHVVGLAITLAAVFNALLQRPLRKAVAEQSSATKAYSSRGLQRSGGSVRCGVVVVCLDAEGLTMGLFLEIIDDFLDPPSSGLTRIV